MEKRKQKTALVIKDCLKLHMVAFHPDGSIQTKVNICSCDECITGDFINCTLELGVKICHRNVDESDGESDEECEYEDEDDGSTEQYELRADSVLDVVQAGSYIALFSPPNALELFYLCKVLEFGVAVEDMQDDYNHTVLKGSKFIKCNYLKKKSEKKGRIAYKILKKTVLVLPTEVMSPMVHLDEKLSLSAAEYQWLADSI